jgi:hypothetical protein
LNNALYGIAISGGGVINNCIANSNGMTGITAAHSTVTNCIANNNWVGISANGSIVTQCTADYNTSTGIITFNSLIRECMFIGNGKGISSEGWNYIVENNSRYNQGWGLYLEVGTQKDFVIKNVASDNGSGNFGPAAGNYMPICGVDATDNCNYGF